MLPKKSLFLAQPFSRTRSTKPSMLTPLKEKKVLQHILSVWSGIPIILFSVFYIQRKRFTESLDCL